VSSPAIDTAAIGVGYGEARSTGGRAPLAGRMARLAAFVVDALLIWVPPVILFAAAGEGRSPFATLELTAAVLWFCGLSLYQIVLLGTTGQTIGKKWLGLQVIHVDGSPVTFGSAFLMRSVVGVGLLGLIPFYGLVDLLFIFGADRRCLHDRVAGTKVIELDDEAA
jgi:uncharacterized RDD family membrane protein YckC